MSCLNLRAVVALLCLFITACGGGGGGGGSDGGGESGAGNFTLSTSSVAFEMVSGSNAPAPQVVKMHLTDTGAAYVGADFKNDPPPDWLTIDIGGSGADFEVLITIFDYTSGGDKSASIVVGTADANGNILHTETVKVSLDLTAAPEVTLSSTNVTTVYGSSNSTVQLTAHVGGSAPYSLQFSSQESWIKPSSAMVETGGDVPITVDASGLEVGSYTGTVLYRDASRNFSSAIAIHLTVSQPALTVTKTPNPLSLGGADGLSLGTAQIDFSINLGSHSVPWTIEADDSEGTWPNSLFHFSSTSGMVSESGATVTITASTENLSSGTYIYAGYLTATLENGDRIQQYLSITFKYTQHSLFASPNGVALTQLPSRSLLSRSITVSDSLGSSSVPWTATSNADWLMVTPSGTTGQKLTLSADTSSLSANRLYLANVTLASSDATINQADVVRVALWVGNSDVSQLSVQSGAQSVATNPVEPYIYVHNGGGVISAYNIHTGSVVASFDTAASALSGMTVSSDGAHLYVENVDTNKMLEIDGKLQSISRQEFAGFPTSSSRMVYTRISGHPVAIINDGRAVYLGPDAEQYFGYHTYIPPGAMTTTLDGTHVYGRDPSTDSGPFTVGALTWISNSSEFVSVNPIASIPTLQTIEDAAVSPDAARAYTSASSPTAFQVLDATSLEQIDSLSANGAPNNAETTWDGRFIGGVVSSGNPVDLSVYSAQGALAKTMSCSGANASTAPLLAGSVVISGDGFHLGCIAQPDGVGTLYLRSTD
jgi:hypothetical protein